MAFFDDFLASQQQPRGTTQPLGAPPRVKQAAQEDQELTEDQLNVMARRGAGLPASRPPAYNPNLGLGAIPLQSGASPSPAGLSLPEDHPPLPLTANERAMNAPLQPYPAAPVQWSQQPHTFGNRIKEAFTGGALMGPAGFVASLIHPQAAENARYNAVTVPAYREYAQTQDAVQNSAMNRWREQANETGQTEYGYPTESAKIRETQQQMAKSQAEFNQIYKTGMLGATTTRANAYAEGQENRQGNNQRKENIAAFNALYGKSGAAAPTPEQQSHWEQMMGLPQGSLQSFDPAKHQLQTDVNGQVQLITTTGPNAGAAKGTGISSYKTTEEAGRNYRARLSREAQAGKGLDAQATRIANSKIGRDAALKDNEVYSEMMKQDKSSYFNQLKPEERMSFVDWKRVMTSARQQEHQQKWQETFDSEKARLSAGAGGRGGGGPQGGGRTLSKEQIQAYADAKYNSTGKPGGGDYQKAYDEVKATPGYKVP